jgi:hypothetical protein
MRAKVIFEGKVKSMGLDSVYCVSEAIKNHAQYQRLFMLLVYAYVK